MTPALCDHRLQFYENDAALFGAVAAYLGDGIRLGQPLVVIATPEHSRGFLERLRLLGVKTGELKASGRLTMADARHTLSRFMVDGAPDGTRFHAEVGGLLEEAAQSSGGVNVRAFGEMVDLLWDEGQCDAALHLERLWNELMRTQKLSLMCAYRMDGFADEAKSARFAEVCGLHAQVRPAVSDALSPDDEARFREISRLQQRARALEAGIAHRKELERSLHDATESLVQADRKKDEFLATLAHELRNPLAPIQSAVQIIRADGHYEPAVESAIDVIDRQLRQMTRLVDDLLDLSRIKTGRLELRRTRLELRELLQTAIEISLPLIEGRGQTLITCMPADAIHVDGDRARLAQVISNLLNNAAKYSDAGGRITVSADAQDGEAIITVQDTGTGIDPGMLEKVFDMFEQADETRDRSLGGLGIGLTLSKRLLELHGGRIAASSAGRGQGSTFTVTVPLASTASRTRSLDAPVTGPAAEDPVGSALRILVVDDNVDAAESMAVLLQLNGYVTRTAHDGVQAIAIADAFRPDVILLDIGLPRMNGHEAAREIRQLAWAKDTALIATSGWGQEADRQRSREAGFDHHLVKPVDQHVLTQLLASVAPASSAVSRS